MQEGRRAVNRQEGTDKSQVALDCGLFYSCCKSSMQGGRRAASRWEGVGDPSVALDLGLFYSCYGSSMIQSRVQRICILISGRTVFKLTKRIMYRVFPVGCRSQKRPVCWQYITGCLLSSVSTDVRYFYLAIAIVSHGKLCLYFYLKSLLGRLFT